PVGDTSTCHCNLDVRTLQDEVGKRPIRVSAVTICVQAHQTDIVHVDITGVASDGIVEAPATQLQLVNIGVQRELDIKSQTVKVETTTVRVRRISGNKVANEKGLPGYLRERLIADRLHGRMRLHREKQKQAAQICCKRDCICYFHAQNPISLMPPSISITAGGLGTPLLVRRSEIRNDRNDSPSSLEGRNPLAPYCTDMRPMFRKISISSSNVAYVPGKCIINAGTLLGIQPAWLLPVSRQSPAPFLKIPGFE